MEIRKIDLSEFAHAVFAEKSKKYKRQGYHQARFLKKNIKDYGTHLYAFLIDINVSLLPVYIWVIEFLLILCGLIPPNCFDLLFYII